MRRDKRIPKKIRVGSRHYDIDYPHVFTERTDVYGRIISDRGIIMVGSKNASGETCVKEHIWQVFWHEVNHAINQEYCGNLIGSEIDPEVLIDSIARGVSQVLTDNFEVAVKKDCK